MKRITKALIRYFSPFGVVTILLLASCGKTPEHDGVGLKLWVQQLSDQDPSMRVTAAEAIGAIGPAALVAEPELRRLAASDQSPKVRVAAIMGLKGVGAATAEFEAYLNEVTKPPVETGPDASDSMGLGDEDMLTDDELMYSPDTKASDDDLEYLQQLAAQADSTIDSAHGSVMPQDEEAQQEWVNQRRKEAVTTLLQEMQNPDVLAQMLISADATQRRFAARLLQNQEGGENQRVFDALTSAKSDSDTALVKIAKEALKKWKNP